MPTVQRNIVRIPNESIHNGDPNNGSVPLTRDASTCYPPNNHLRDGDPGNGTVSLMRQGSPVQPPNHRFNVVNAGMSQPPSPIQPGQGSVPVQPFSQTGTPIPASTLRDAARQ